MDRREARADAGYIRVTQQINGVTGACALAFHALTALAVAHSMRSLAWVGACVLVTLPINVWITAVLLPRSPSLAELTRLIVNVGACLIQNPAIGWPLPVWLWLPYVAVTFDGFRPRTVWSVLTVMCVANGVVAWHDGVSWLYPVTFTGLAYFCRFVAERRLAVIRTMFEQSDEDHRALDEAHASLKSAHDRLKSAVEARDRAELVRRQSQKLEAVGRLAAGVAHEINTPLQFVNDSMDFVREGVTEVLDLVRRYEAILQEVGRAVPKVAADAAAARDLSDFSYLEARLPEALERSSDGLGRVATIVRGLKSFAHPDQKEKSAADLNGAIQAALAITRNAYKYVADVVCDLGDLPPVPCRVGELNQVFVNIIVNAAQAITQTAREVDPRGVIEVRSWREPNAVCVAIRDTGGGIPEAARAHIFDPFFTTKEVGQGSGQGLTIARSIVVEGHQGTLTFETESGRGTTFVVSIPLDPLPAQPRAA